MTYLCINDINNISLSNISIKENNHNYKIFYNLNEIITYGISFHCKGIIKKYEGKYKIIIFNDKIINLIDQYLKRQIKNYNSFIKKDKDNNTFIEIKENQIINNILLKYKNKNYYYLNIKLINKYNNTAVIYLI